jgi:Ca2+-binding RTX toxin-like protein
MALIIGTSNNEELYNTSGNDLINALDGDDTIFGSVYQNDTIDGGLGIDTVDYSASGATSFIFTLLNPTGENITGTISYSDIGYQDLLYSIEEIVAPLHVGSDAITGSAISGTASINVNLSTNSLKIIDANTPPISITVKNFENVTGTDRDDTIVGSSQFNGLDGGQGNDFLDGKEGDDTLSGSFGHDTLYGGSGNDFLDGGLGDDFLYGDDGNDILTGGYGGNDLLDGGFGNDYITGGFEGDDTLYGGYGDDTLDGVDGNDFIEGGYGDDTLYGRDGSDTLHGGDGNDWLNGGGGKDTLAGGKGNDIYFIDSIDDAISEYSTTPTEIDTVYADASFTLSGNLENLFLTGEAIKGIGNSQNNWIVGNPLANVIKGSGGDDTLDGGVSEGGGGSDLLQGGAGTDTFVLQKSIYSFDTISDFEANEKLLVSASAFGGGLTPGLLDSTKLLIGVGDIKEATTADQRFIFNTTNKSLYFDVDGLNGLESVKIAVLTGFSGLNSSNFLIVA